MTKYLEITLAVPSNECPNCGEVIDLERQEAQIHVTYTCPCCKADLEYADDGLEAEGQA